MKPWERLDEESGHAYEAFVAYRDLPKRTLKAVQDSLAISVSVTRIHEWKHRFEWHKRAVAWDRHLSSKRDKHLAARLSKERSKIAKSRLKCRSLVIAQAMKTLEQINKSSLAVCEPGELLELLRATRQAFELIGLSQIDFDEQLQRLASQPGQAQSITVSVTEPDPEDLLGLPDESNTVQREDSAEETLLDQTD